MGKRSLRILHEANWNLSPSEAVERQRRLAEGMRERGPPPRRPTRPVRLAGADVSYDKHSDRLYGGVVALQRNREGRWETIEERWAVGRAEFPYVPGLLSFREIPILLKPFEQLNTLPDGVLVDGQGYAHPRRFGLACHLAWFLGIPTIGCAKSRLVGEWEGLGPRKGDRVPLQHRGERVGTVLRSRDGCRPLFVSVGAGISLAQAERWCLESLEGYRLPEPTRRAHRLVNRIRRRGALDL